MKIINMLATASLVAIAATSAFAQVGARPQIYSDVVPPDRGTAEIGLAIDAKLDSPTSTTVNLRFLPYLNRQVQLGGDLTYGHASGFSGGTIELRGDYNFVPSPSVDFATRRSVPYVGAAIGTTYGDLNGSSWGVQGGLKHFLTNDVSVFGEVRYRDFSEGGNETRLLIGLNTYLRK